MELPKDYDKNFIPEKIEGNMELDNDFYEFLTVFLQKKIFHLLNNYKDVVNTGSDKVNTKTNFLYTKKIIEDLKSLVEEKKQREEAKKIVEKPCKHIYCKVDESKGKCYICGHEECNERMGQ